MNFKFYLSTIVIAKPILSSFKLISVDLAIAIDTPTVNTSVAIIIHLLTTLAENLDSICDFITSRLLPFKLKIFI